MGPSSLQVYIDYRFIGRTEREGERERKGRRRREEGGEGEENEG